MKLVARFVVAGSFVSAMMLMNAPRAEAGLFAKLFGKCCAKDECCAPEPVCCEPEPEPVCCEPAPEPVCCEPEPEPVCCEPAPEPVCCEPEPEPCCEPAPEPEPCCASYLPLPELAEGEVLISMSPIKLTPGVVSIAVAPASAPSKVVIKPASSSATTLVGHASQGGL